MGAQQSLEALQSRLKNGSHKSIEKKPSGVVSVGAAELVALASKANQRVAKAWTNQSLFMAKDGALTEALEKITK